MASAVDKVPDTETPVRPTSLLLASWMSAAYVLFGFVLVLYGIPTFWASVVTPAIEPTAGSFIDFALRAITQIAAIVGLAWLGSLLAGTHPPEGIRGGIFVVISTIFTAFFLLRAIGEVAQRNFSETTAYLVAGFVSALFLFFLVRLIRSPRYQEWMRQLEHQGWFHSRWYKRNQGQLVRRLTVLGILLILFPGIWVLLNSSWLVTTVHGDWLVSLPFTSTKLLLLPDIQYTLPLLLGAAAIWFANRVVNIPEFADFLIATEAEMKKVSWTTRKRLVSDTIVVLVTVFLMTIFLMIIDLFWGWLLSRSWIAVLPPHTQTTIQKESDDKKLKW